MSRWRVAAATVVLGGLVQGCHTTRTGSKAEGATQKLTPVEQIDTWLDGMHVMRDDARMVMEVHHYCDIVDEQLIQCALYDRSGPKAHLVGVEYVVTQEAFDALPEREQRSWHPHNYEVLSGMLVAPGMPTPAEQAVMSRLLNTYGKSWHTWMPAERGGGVAQMPTGIPRLGWSFNADGEAPARLVSARAERLGIDPDAVRERRQRFVRAARPQQGVDTMAEDFPNRRPIPGVREEKQPRERRGTD